MKKTKVFLFLLPVLLLVSAGISAAPQHFLGVHFEGDLPGNGEIQDYYSPGTVDFKNTMVNFGIGAQYDFAPAEFISIGVGLNFNYKAYSNQITYSNPTLINEEDFNFYSLEPFIAVRGFQKLSSGFELFAGLSGGYIGLVGSNFISSVTNTAKELSGGAPSFKVFAGCTYQTGIWHNVIEAGYKFANISSYNMAGTAMLNNDGSKASTDFGGIYIGVSTGIIFGSEIKEKHAWVAGPVYAQLKSEETTATDGSYSAAEPAVAATAPPEAAPAATAGVTQAPTLEPTKETAAPTAEPAKENAAPTAVPAETPQVEGKSNIQVDTSSLGSDEGIVILSPGETSPSELEKYILSKRKFEKPAEEAGTDNIKVTFEGADEEGGGGVILMEAQDKGTLARAGYVMVERAGFISDNFKEDGFIYSVDGREILSAGDFVYMKVTIGKGFKKGTEFTIYDDTEEIYDPMTDAYMGKWINITGAGKVIENSEENIWKVKITKSYDLIHTNYKIKMRRDLKEYYNKITTTIKKKTPPMEAFIIKVHSGATGSLITVKSKDVVYIDRGIKDGLLPGEKMSIYRPVANKEEDKTDKYHRIGKLIIINSMRESCVGLVTQQDTTIQVGDIVKTPAK